MNCVELNVRGWADSTTWSSKTPSGKFQLNSIPYGELEVYQMHKFAFLGNLGFASGKAVIWVIQHIPLRILRVLGRMGGTATYYVAHTRRRVALDNLDLAYGDGLTPPEKITIAKSSFINLVTTILEFCYSPVIDRPIEHLVEVVNAEAFFKAYREGKGIIILVPHMGNWEVCGRWYGEHGVEQYAIVRRQKQDWVNRIVTSVRKTNLIKEIDKKNGLKKALAALRRGEMVSILIDQHAQKEAVEVEFFGQPAMTHASVALLAMRTGCKVMVCSGFRHRDGSFGGVFSEPIETTASGDRGRDLVENTQRYVEVIEFFVRKNPQDWMWMHRRWKPPRDKGSSAALTTSASEA